MKKSERMKPVARVTETREKEAARALGDTNRELQQHEQRLSELQNYRDEYLRYCQEKGSDGISAAKFQELQRFLVNLNKAVEQQRQLVDFTQQTLAMKKNSWQNAHSRTRAMDTVIDRYRKQEQQSEQKREQREQDEIGSRKDGKGF
jgi:flagellar FliJ protein